MTTLEAVARQHYRERVRLVDALAAVARELWRQVDPANIAVSWFALVPQLYIATSASQLAAANAADAYLDASLTAQGASAESTARVNPAALVGVASDGRDLQTLLYQPAITSLRALRLGAPVPRALASGYAALDMLARTQVADAGRTADQLALTAHRDVSGYVRMVVGKTCGRCVILAGRQYRWNAGFRRHPRCDCIHVPAREDVAGDIRTDPNAWFKSLSRAEQDKQFTKAGARAIRDGADIFQVVNARRGAFGLTPAGARITAEERRALLGGRDRGQLQAVDVFGRQLFVTTEGTTPRGIAGVRLGAKESGDKQGGRHRQAKAPRLMPESIYAIANGNRDEALRLLKRFGYIL